MTTTEKATVAGKFVDLPSARLHYVEAGSGHPVVLLHGSGPGATAQSNFSPNIQKLAEKFRVIGPDMPGWGKSDSPGESGYDHTRTLIELLDALSIEKAALVGNSMGGLTAISASVAHPQRVSHLVTMGAPGLGAPLLFSPRGPSEGIRTLVGAYFEPTSDNLKRLVQVMCFDQNRATDALVQERTDAALSRQDHLESFRTKFLDYFEATTAGLAGKASTISVPTLVIHGRDDRVVSYESSLQLVTQIPDSRLLLLNQCGHWAQIEHADEFNRAVASFIQNRGPDHSSVVHAHQP